MITIDYGYHTTAIVCDLGGTIALRSDCATLELKSAGRTDIRSEVFNNHIANTQLDIAFEALVNPELAYVRYERICGTRKTIERWFASSDENAKTQKTHFV